jgi:hypothetical protein
MTGSITNLKSPDFHAVHSGALDLMHLTTTTYGLVSAEGYHLSVILSTSTVHEVTRVHCPDTLNVNAWSQAVAFTWTSIHELIKCLED